MKSLQVILITLSLMILVPLLVVESSSLNDTAVSNIGSSVTTTSNDTYGSNTSRGLSVSSTPSDDTSARNITRGSSVSAFANDTATYWYSPSGEAAFGFYIIRCTRYSLSYPFCADHYGVGTFFFKSPTLCWTSNRDIYKVPSSVLLNNEGKLVLLEDNKEQPLIPNLQEPASYAMMHDNGNFVLYGSKSQILWQSFEHPAKSHLSILEVCLLIVKLVVGLVVFFGLLEMVVVAVKAVYMELCQALTTS